MPDRRMPWLWAALLLAAAPAVAHGHKMMAHGRVYEDGTVLVQGFFPDGKPAMGVAVEVRRPDGSIFLQGEADETGKLTFKPDGPPGQWSATFTGSMGHKTSASFTVGAPVGAEQPPAPGAPPAAVPGAGAAAQGDLRVREPFPWTGVLAGLGFIFGLSALLTCISLRKELRRLKGDGPGTRSG